VARPAGTGLSSFLVTVIRNSTCVLSPKVCAVTSNPYGSLSMKRGSSAKTDSIILFPEDSGWLEARSWVHPVATRMVAKLSAAVQATFRCMSDPFQVRGGGAPTGDSEIHSRPYFSPRNIFEPPWSLLYSRTARL